MTFKQAMRLWDIAIHDPNRPEEYDATGFAIMYQGVTGEWPLFNQQQSAQFLREWADAIEKGPANAVPAQS